jgi:hypothetical protein
MIIEIYELIPEQERFLNKRILIEFAKFLIEMTLTLLDYP